ncbi:MFS transporter [Parapedobacter pyrenivorans]|uniref:MFS transporter n=1 Tax=Parapedobacter pyrenivorans TaxID=1305674 RepID=A0A917M3N4_9SPHI|nr:MFS transporter [Parapedobacter pyrenivorans]GGG73256.1 MFS transporter [Parapedobacter pyrenivorans]
MNVKNGKYYPWLLVALLCVVGALNYLDRMIITTMRGSIVEAIPMTDAQFGLLTSAFLWLYGFFSPVAGYLADRFNRSRVIILSLFIWSLLTWLTSLASSFEELLIIRALMGFSEACYIPAALALIVDYHQGKTKSTATGLHIGGIYVGQSLGFIGGWLAESHSWNYAFSIFGIIGIVYALVLIFLLKDRADKPVQNSTVNKQEKLDFWKGLKVLFGNQSFILVLIVWGLAGSISWMINGWLPTYYQEHFDLSQTEAGVYATAYFFTAMLLGVISGGAIADWWSRTNSRARVLLPAIGFLIAVPGVFVASYTDFLLITVMGFTVYAFTRPFIDANMMPILDMIADKRYLATGYGILNLFSCVIGGIGIYAAGALRDEQVNLSLIFQVAAFTMVICALLLFWLKPKKKVVNY